MASFIKVFTRECYGKKLVGETKKNINADRWPQLQLVMNNYYCLTACEFGVYLMYSVLVPLRSVPYRVFVAGE